MLLVRTPHGSVTTGYRSFMDGGELVALAEDLIAGLSHGKVAAAHPAYTLRRVDDGSVLEIDLGEPDNVYVVTIAAVPRLL